MHISFLTPRLPPAVCGVGDHTARLAEALHSEGVKSSFFVCRPGPPTGLPTGPVHAWSGKPADLEAAPPPPRGRLALGPAFRLRLLAMGSALSPRFHFARAEASLAWRPHCDLPSRDPLRHTATGMEGTDPFAVATIHRRPGRAPGGCRLHLQPALARSGHRAVRDRPPPGRPVGHGRHDSSGCDVSTRAETSAAIARLEGGRGRRDRVRVFPDAASRARTISTSAPKGIGSRGTRPRRVRGGGTRRGSRRTPPVAGPAARPLEILGHRAAEEIASILACSDFAFPATPRALLDKSTAFAAMAEAGLAVIASTDPLPPSEDGLPILSAESWDWDRCRSEAVTQAREALRRRAQTHSSWKSIAERALAVLSSQPRA